MAVYPVAQHFSANGYLRIHVSWFVTGHKIVMDDHSAQNLVRAHEFAVRRLVLRIFLRCLAPALLRIVGTVKACSYSDKIDRRRRSLLQCFPESTVTPIMRSNKWLLRCFPGSSRNDKVVCFVRPSSVRHCFAHLISMTASPISSDRSWARRATEVRG